MSSLNNLLRPWQGKSRMRGYIVQATSGLTTWGTWPPTSRHSLGAQESTRPQHPLISKRSRTAAAQSEPRFEGRRPEAATLSCAVKARARRALCAEAQTPETYGPRSLHERAGGAARHASRRASCTADALTNSTLPANHLRETGEQMRDDS
jgi:hypothetical protein